MSTEEYNLIRDNAVKDLKTEPILDFFTNEKFPNLTYGQFLNDEMLEKLAIIYKPSVTKSYLETYDPKNEPSIEELKTEFKDVIYEQRLKKYLRPPNPAPIDDFFPSYAKKKLRYEESLKDLEDPERVLQRQLIYSRGNLPDRYVSGVQAEPAIPIGYEKTQDLLNAGYNPDNVLRNTPFKLAMAFFAGENATPETYNYAVRYAGTTGVLDEEGKDGLGFSRDRVWKSLTPTFAYAIPGDPNNSIAYFEDPNNPAILDLPSVSAMDFAEFGLANGLPILSEIIAGNKILQAKKLKNLAKLGVDDVGTFMKGVDKFKEYNLLGIAGAGPLFVQRVMGRGLGYHDYTLTEMGKETGLLYVLSGLSQASIDAIVKGIPDGIKFMFRGKALDNEELVEFKQAIDDVRKQRAEGGEYKNVFEGTEVTVKDINEAIQEIAADVGKRIGPFDPTAGQASKSTYFSNLEKLLRTQGAGNKKYIDIMNELEKGNTEVRDQFFQAIFDGLDTPLSGASVAEDVAGTVGQERKAFVQEGQNIINKFIKEMEQLEQIGKSPVDEVIAKDFSTELRPVTVKRIAEATSDYRKALNANDVIELERFGLNEVTIDRATNVIRQAVKALDDVDELRSGFGAGRKKAEQEMFEIFPPETRARIEAYSKNDFTIPELMDLRKQITGYRGTLDPSDAVGSRLNKPLLDLELSIDQQITKTAKRELNAEDFLNFQTIQQNSYRKMKESYLPVLTDIARKNPEQIFPYFVKQTVKGGNINTPLNTFIKYLDNLGSEGIQIKNSLRNDLIEHIRFNILDPNVSPLQQSKNYLDFMKNYRSITKELFQEDNAFKFGNSSSFRKNLLPEIEKFDATVAELNRNFGEGTPYNIVSDIFQKLGGDGTAFAKLENLTKIVDSRGSDILKQDIKQIFKKFVLDNASTNGAFDATKYSSFLGNKFNKGAGEPASLEAVATLAMGKKEGLKFIRNMDILTDFTTRINRDEFVDNNGMLKVLTDNLKNSELNYLKRFFLPPLTQIGRRVTAAEKALQERSGDFIRKLILDAKDGGRLFDQLIKGIENNRNARMFLKLLGTNYQREEITKDYEQFRYTEKEKDIIENRNRQENEENIINELVQKYQSAVQ